MVIPDGPICVIGLDSKHKADFIIEAKAGSQNLLMWPEIREGVPLHPYHLRVCIEALLEEGESVVIVTQSPVVVGCFSDIPENVFVASGAKVFQLTDKYDRIWLQESGTDLGDLYNSGCLEIRDELDHKVQRMMGWI